MQKHETPVTSSGYKGGHSLYFKQPKPSSSTLAEGELGLGVVYAPEVSGAITRMLTRNSDASPFSNTKTETVQASLSPTVEASKPAPQSDVGPYSIIQIALVGAIALKLLNRLEKSS